MSHHRGRRFAPAQRRDGYQAYDALIYEGHRYPARYEPYPSTYYTNTRPSGSGYNYWRDEAMPYTSNPYYRDSYGESSGRHLQTGPGASESRRPRRYHTVESQSNRSCRRGSSPIQPRRQHYSTDRSPALTQPLLFPPTFRMKTPPTDLMPPVTDAPTVNHPKPMSPSSAKHHARQPDSEYLAFSQQPSTHLSDPLASRKLLVLDLNGTLLVRSSHAGHSRLRAVHPRPYIPAFRAYLFAPETQAWLDTMVWSSAQPHSVADMVDKVFGPYKHNLKAVWNRQSLGLTTQEYHRKTLTTKDLTKPWKSLSLSVSPAELPEQSPTPERSTFALPDGSSPLAHSALTTLLLDDSPHKALLQPYNHVCIPEYDSARRSRDLLSLHACEKSSKKSKVKNVVKTGAEPSAEHSTTDSDLSVSDPCINETSGSASSYCEEPFDVALLAIIGVLDGVKWQDNVAGWVRRGGLLDIGRKATSESFAGEAGGKKKAENETSREQRVLDETTMRGDETMVASIDNAANSTSELTAFAIQEDAELQATTWFDDGLTLAYWVTRGRKALLELGIEAAHGLTG